MKRARVKDVIYAAKLNGLAGVKKYFAQSNLITDPSTWSNNIKNLLNENKTTSVMAEIELIITKFNFYDVSKKRDSN